MRPTGTIQERLGLARRRLADSTQVNEASDPLLRNNTGPAHLLLVLRAAWIVGPPSRLRREALKAASQRPAGSKTGKTSSVPMMTAGAAGLDNDDAAKVNVNLALVNSRLLAMDD